MKAITNYLKSSFAELSQVTWPTKNQAVKLTILVFVFCLLSAAVVGIVDLAFNEGYTQLLNLR